ncbi:MAG: YoaK family protein, partial [Reyranella sp.]|nr:YoaK family protein [Reyranella sp.]
SPWTTVVWACSTGKKSGCRVTSSDNTTWQGCVLAIVAGYADAVGFLTFGAFAGAMTGNTVLLGIALAEADFGAAVQSAIIIAAFLVGVAASALLGRRVPLVAIFGLEAAAIVAAAWLAPVFAAPVLAFAMGLQNATMSRFAGASLNTVVLTGNLQKMMQGLVGRFTGAATPPGSDAAQSTMIAGLWIAYLAGVVAGALAHHWIVHPLLPVVLLLPLALIRRPDGSAD